ncbi:MAG: alpha-amylase [Chloroflexi bacterium]|nr:alpha-amylase [Chloroflexota bacterium]
MNQLQHLILLFLLMWLVGACQTADIQPTVTPTTIPTDTSAPPTSIPPPTPNPLVQGSAGLPWWNDTVFYEVFVRSFNDSDGDGIGDINGLIEKLDYLNDGDPATDDDLGVTGIWLMPIMESPSYHGYDVVDYYQVNPDYGSSEDFQRLMDEAHKRGMRVIVDLVLNHTSREHPWFENVGAAASDQRDWYVWSEDDPSYRGPWGQKVWHKTPEDYYYAVFWEGMPDLNLENGEVTAEMLAATQFWLDEMGADGFRLDAIKHLIEDGQIQENSQATHEWLQDFYIFYKDVDPGAFTVGEAWTSTQQALKYTGDEVDITFQFDLAEDIVNSSKVGLGSMVANTQSEIAASFPPNQYATFITNHDQNRVMSQLDGDEAKAKVAASILLTAPGVPFIYYGEEIGMMGMKPDENIRRPMQWSGDSFRTGFTTGSPWRAPHNDFADRSVQIQLDDPDSLLSHYKNLIQLRNTHEALRVGDWTLVESKPGRIYAFLRHTDEEIILVLINTSSKETTDYTLSLETSFFDGPVVAELLFGAGDVAAPDVNAAGGFTDYRPLASLPHQSTFVIQLILGSE